jgi:CspA family cold shock protein
VQGVITAFDPGTGSGVVMRDTDLAEFDLARGALEGTVFRMLRPGQRVCFELDGDGYATGLNLGSEVDMGTPSYLLHPDAVVEPVSELG